MECLNYYWFTPIPKKEWSKKIQDYRPISLANYSHKFITKVLGIYTRKNLDSLVSITQNAFIKGHMILDSMATAQEVLFPLKEDKCEGIFFRIDFDRLSITYVVTFCLMFSRTKQAFSDRWIKWIKGILFSSKASCLVNGKQGKYFKIKKGPKQGCPLLSILFILVVDAFDVITRHASNMGCMALFPKNGW